jgi:hypothetical protein
MDLTDKLARVLEDLKQEFNTHFVVLSHAGSDFTIPTENNPIVTNKIVAWSGSLEQAADNIAGTFRTDGDRLNFFFTKVRYGDLLPRHYTFRMDYIHSRMYYELKDQVTTNLVSLDLGALEDLYQNEGMFDDIPVDEDEEWEKL